MGGLVGGATAGAASFFAQSSRFLILAARTQLPNLGTRALRLCLERLSADWQAEHGYPLLEQLGSLRERLAAGVSEFRKGQGKRHRIAAVLSIAACTKLAGVMGDFGPPAPALFFLNPP